MSTPQRALTLVAVALAAAPATADLFYRARTWQEGDRPAEAVRMTVEAWVDGEQADIRFTESGNPFMAAGSRLVTTDGGKTLYLVNDEEQTVSPWDLEAVLGMASALLEGMGPLLKFEIQNAKVETLAEEPGGEVAGYPTTHYRFRTSYDILMKIMGIKRAQHVETVQDTWATDALDDPALGVWLVRNPPDLGDSGLAELLRLEREKQRGFPLKTVIEEISEGQKKKRQRTIRTITEVLEVGERDAPADAYVWPSHYRKVDQMPAAATATQ
jgi:hypothetical protein